MKNMMLDAPTLGAPPAVNCLDITRRALPSRTGAQASHRERIGISEIVHFRIFQERNEIARGGMANAHDLRIRRFVDEFVDPFDARGRGHRDLTLIDPIPVCDDNLCIALPLTQRQFAIGRHCGAGGVRQPEPGVIAHAGNKFGNDLPRDRNSLGLDGNR